MDTPLVSIMVLTYQHENYIEDCIKGLLSQTYSNMELLIADDASTDATLDIIDRNLMELNKKFVRVEIIRHPENTGNIAHNINELLKMAKGEYFRLSAGDDALLPDCVETLVEYLEINKEDVLVYSNAFIVPDTWHIGKSFMKNTIYTKTYEPPSFENAFSTLIERNYVASPTIMIRSSVYKKYGYYDEELKQDDWDMLLKLARKEKFGYVNKVLTYYRKSQTSVSNSNTRRKFVDGYNFRVNVLNKYLRYVEKDKRIAIKKAVMDLYIKMAIQKKYYDYAMILLLRRYKLYIVGKIWY